MASCSFRSGLIARWVQVNLDFAAKWVTGKKKIGVGGGHLISNCLDFEIVDKRGHEFIVAFENSLTLQNKLGYPL